MNLLDTGTDLTDSIITLQQENMPSHVDTSALMNCRHLGPNEELANRNRCDKMNDCHSVNAVPSTPEKR